MTAPNPAARRKRPNKDTTPQTKRTVRGKNTGRGPAAVRARGTNTSNLDAAQMAEVIDPDKPLSDKQKQFVRNWAQGDSITSAALRAGYSEGSIKLCYRLVKMPNVLALKSKYELEWEEDNKMSRQRVMNGMLEAIEMAKLMAEPSSMIAGWREIGKICGYYAPVEHKVKVDVTGNIMLDKLNALSDAELLNIINGKTSATALLPSAE